jgi:hypothetical protein
MVNEFVGVFGVFSFNSKSLDLLYRGATMKDHPVTLGGYVLPEEYLFEIDARNLPANLSIFNPMISTHCVFLLPNAKGLISSKSEYFGLIIKKVSENGVLIEISMSASDWYDPLSQELFFDELLTIFKESYNMEPVHYDLDPNSNHFYLDYHLEIPSFNLKEVYHYANELVTKVENEAYRKMVRIAIDNLRGNKRMKSM